MKLDSLFPSVQYVFQNAKTVTVHPKQLSEHQELEIKTSKTTHFSEE